MKSRFRTIFWVGNTIIPVVSIILLVYCVKSIINNEDFLVGNIVIGILCLLTLVVGFFALLDVKKIHLNENEIELIFLFTSRKETIHISEVKEIKLKKRQGVYGEYKNDGYFYHEIKLSNRELIISPTIYENYNDLIRKLKQMKS